MVDATESQTVHCETWSEFNAATRGDFACIALLPDEDMMDQEVIDWMTSRPESVKELMRVFPPACTVRLRDDAPLCNEHANRIEDTFSVQSYLEDGKVGIMSNRDDVMIRVPVEHLSEPIGFHNAQDADWVADILGSCG
jgi:hypothetical protein